MWRSWSTCWSIAAGAARASSTSCCSRGPATAESPLLGGLIDVDVLSKHGYDEKKSGLVAGRSGSSRPQVGGVWESVKLTSEPVSMLVPDDSEFEIEESAYRGAHQNGHHVIAMAGVK